MPAQATATPCSRSGRPAASTRSSRGPATASCTQWDDPATDTAPTHSSGSLGAEAGDLAVTPDGAHVIVAALTGDALRVMDGDDVSTVESHALDVNAVRIALAETTAGVRLHAARTDETIRVFGVDPAPPTRSRP